MNEREVDGVVVIALSGEMKNVLSDQLKRRLRELLDDGRRRFVVNLAGLTFIHSYGISVLVSAAKRARKDGGDLRFACLDHATEGLFRMVRLDKVFRLFPTEEEAIRSFDS